MTIVAAERFTEFPGEALAFMAEMLKHTGLHVQRGATPPSALHTGDLVGYAPERYRALMVRWLGAQI